MIAHLDCSTGVSGDKLLGALLDAGKDGAFTPDHLQALLARIEPNAHAAVRPVRSHGIAAVGVKVEAEGQPESRSWREVREMIDAAGLDANVLRRSLKAFEELARAESEAHGRPADEIHFHEVGGLDSIMDVVGVCAGAEALGIEELFVTPVAVGSGTVDTSHGVLPVPAPATALLLLGVPTVPGPAGTELTTPTGAALLRALDARFAPAPPMVPRSIGYGAGTREIGCANVCRIIVAERFADPLALRDESVTLLETNIDHISPESAAFAAEELLAEGALDVWTSPVVMKKGRSAFTMSALVSSAGAAALAGRMSALTGSLGIRRRDVGRLVADRETRTVETGYGPVRFKVGAGRARPEADDVARVARATSRSFDEVENELLDLL